MNVKFAKSVFLDGTITEIMGHAIDANGIKDINFTEKGLCQQDNFKNIILQLNHKKLSWNNCSQIALVEYLVVVNSLYIERLMNSYFFLKVNIQYEKKMLQKFLLYFANWKEDVCGLKE